MRVRVYFASRRTELLEHAQRPQAVDGDDYLKQNGISCELVPLNERALQELITNEALIKDRANVDGYVLLVERGLEVSAGPGIRTVTLACIFDAPIGLIVSPQNFLKREVVRAVKFFRSIKASVEGHHGIWRLPIRNFESQHFRDFVGWMANGHNLNDVSRVHNQVQSHMQQLRKALVQPRRQSSYQTKYCVDDRSRYFVLGHEEHARIDTATPHVSLCVALNSFRFGIKLSEEHHFNVSMGDGDRTHIAGEFIGCHGEERVVGRGEGRKHLNMFSNDFF
jgi:hypothetical protein